MVTVLRVGEPDGAGELRASADSLSVAVSGRTVKIDVDAKSCAIEEA